ncbi:DNA polymerase III, epsilon subunit [Cohaesibacter sp. ES.047]|uniref:3'-5' exonuclease n=1 Tax=Cohaesibacter sp. ES.047 TaxID=1798205 RepID=UPI000BB83BB3|nr:3'-5' exonuclease [Cohaesibacter sp. ES.047]SNY92300.1 DNA polymerase III, epsilon subunit [Cohaesibacter sp. ES.047]
MPNLFQNLSEDTLKCNPFPSGPFRFIALDVETANNDRSSICQIGIACVCIDDRMNTWSSYINPCTDNWSCTWVHKITQSHVQDAPSFPDVLRLLLPHLDGHTVFQHSSFDRSAINAACAANGLSHPDWDWRDSIQIAKLAWPELKGNGGYGLASLKEHLNLRFRHHDGEEDARAAAEIILRAEQHMGKSLVPQTTTSQHLQSSNSSIGMAIPSKQTTPQKRVKRTLSTRMQLKAQIMEKLNAIAEEHGSGHQAVYANRYVFSTSSGKLCELMFQKDERSPANLWVLEQLVPKASRSHIQSRFSPAGSGRHSALKKMPQLNASDLTCFALATVAELNEILAEIREQ